MKKILALLSLLFVSLTVTGMAMQFDDLADGYAIQLIRNCKVLGTLPMSKAQRDNFIALEKARGKSHKHLISSRAFMDSEQGKIGCKQAVISESKQLFNTEGEIKVLAQRFESSINDSLKDIEFDQYVVLSPYTVPSKPDCITPIGMLFPVR